MKISSKEREEFNRQIQSQNKKIQELESLLTMCNLEKSEGQNQISVLQSRLVQLDTPNGEHVPVVYEKQVQEIHTTVIKEVTTFSTLNIFVHRKILTVVEHKCGHYCESITTDRAVTVVENYRIVTAVRTGSAVKAMATG